jgi:hypothetical protein
LAVLHAHSPDGGLSAGHAATRRFRHGPAAAAAAPGEAAGAGADPRRHRRSGWRDGLRRELDEPLADTAAGSARGRDVIGVAALVRTERRVPVALPEPVFLLAEHVPVAAGLHTVFVLIAGASVDDADDIHDTDDLDLTDHVHHADDIHHADYVHDADYVHVGFDVNVGFRADHHVCVVRLVVVRADVRLVEFSKLGEFGGLRTGLPVRLALSGCRLA